MTAFDPIAPIYDREFTHSLAGILQRQAVRKYLDRSVARAPSLRVLELGCGTGEDAIFLADAGHHVLAVDISEQMIRVARAKAERLTLKGRVRFEVMDMRQLDAYILEGPFDLIYSNFGALNCIDHQEIKTLLTSLQGLLTPNGRIVAVLMPSFCLWESAYFILKAKWQEVFRRMKRQGIVASLGTSGITTWYYAPRLVRRYGRPHLVKVRTRPVGFFLPPSYLNPYFRKRRRLLNFLSEAERLVSGVSLLSGASDHYIIEWKRKA